MTKATDALTEKLTEYTLAQEAYMEALRQYNAAKLALKDTELELYYEAYQNGTLDGKNAEARDAQAVAYYRSNSKWIHNREVFIRAEEGLEASKSKVAVETMGLKVQAMVVNAEIAGAGMKNLIGEVSLAGA